LLKFKEDFVEITPTESALNMKCGRAKAIALFRKEAVSKRIKEITPKEGDWSELPSQFSDNLLLLSLKNVPVDILAKVGGVFVTDDVMFATDNTSVIKLKTTAHLLRMWLSSHVVSILRKIPVTHYCSNGSWLHFRAEEVHFSCRRLIDEKYPYETYRAIMSSVVLGPIKGVFTKDIIELLGRATVFAKDTDGDYVVSLTFTEGLCTITSGSGSGSYEEAMEMEVSTPDPHKIVVSALRLRQAIEKWEELPFILGEIRGNPVIIMQSDSYMEVLSLIKA
jgi:hypothetical protein